MPPREPRRTLKREKEREMGFFKRNGAVTLIIGAFLLALISLLVGSLQNSGDGDISFDPNHFTVETVGIPTLTSATPHG